MTAHRTPAQTLPRSLPANGGTSPLKLSVALGITDHAWSIGELIDAALTAVPPKPTPTAPDRRRQFRVIEGGRK
jgi:hypothetical protein